MYVPEPQPAKMKLVARRISQSEVARRADVGHTHLSRVLNGYIRPSGRLVTLLAELLDEKPEALFRPDALERRARFPGDKLIGGGTSLIMSLIFLATTVLAYGLTPEQRSRIARMGGLAKAATTDGRQATAPARSAFIGRFERQVDPDGTLTPQERSKRARAALRLHMSRLALKSSKARSRRSGGAQ